MPQLEQWLRLMMLVSRMAQGLLIKRLAVNIAVLLALAMLVGALLATLLMMGLYATYQLLLQHGIGMNMALLITAGIAALLALVFSLIGRHRFRRVAGEFSMRPALAAKVSAAVEAFIDGLLTPTVPKD